MIFKRNLITVTLTVLAICACLRIDGNAQTNQTKFDEYGRWINGVSEPWLMSTTDVSEDEAAKARLRWEVIGAENETAENEWAGDYRVGDIHGAYLRLSARGTFVLMSVYSCAASVTDVDYGRASIAPDLVQLFSERPVREHSGTGSHSHSYHVSTRRFVPVKWGTWYFLVPEKEIAQFAEDLAGVNRSGSAGGSEEGLESFWKLKNQSRPVSGLPVFPPAYQQYMRKPVDAEIVKLGVRRIVKSRDAAGLVYFESRISVTIGAGRKDGVKRGMTLYFTTPGDESLEVDYAGAKTSTGVVTRYLDKNMVETFTDYSGNTPQIKILPPIHLGQQVSSSIYRVP